MDSGLFSYLVEYTSARELQLSSDYGNCLKIYIVSEIIKAYDNNSIPLDDKNYYIPISSVINNK